jgi:hypothetical protein
MNERILKLAEQAGWDRYEALDERNQKFAELIVRECASIAQTYMSHWPEDHELTKQIKEHFGFKE